MKAFFRRWGSARLVGVATLLTSLSIDGAQAASGCAAPLQAADGNLVVHCRHVTIEIEQGADVSLTDRDRSGEPHGASLKSGAIYIDDVEIGRRGSFQIRTPDAIASVRGTSWAVDVGRIRSSVFVVSGVVGVRRRLDGQAVTLTAGQGVDVAPETTPLVVKRWPAERVRALLARFGR